MSAGRLEPGGGPIIPLKNLTFKTFVKQFVYNQKKNIFVWALVYYRGPVILGILKSFLSQPYLNLTDIHFKPKKILPVTASIGMISKSP
jgi:hypothetical protein